MVNDKLQLLQAGIKPFRNQLVNHPLYRHIDTMQKMKLFMESHVFAVWDFMSLLKSLQRHLTCIEVPWTPKGDATTRYLINEIVTGEESDIDQHGNRISHFELYLQAMKQAGCNVSIINDFVSRIAEGHSLDKCLQDVSINISVSNFINNTFATIKTDKPHIIAAVFTFGREDLIPDMFLSFVKKLNERTDNRTNIFQYYLERHIEVDGGHHSHLAFQMMEKLCGNNKRYWEEATVAVQNALKARIELWNSILLNVS